MFEKSGHAENVHHRWRSLIDRLKFKHLLLVELSRSRLAHLHLYNRNIFECDLFLSLLTFSKENKYIRISILKSLSKMLLRQIHLHTGLYRQAMCSKSGMACCCRFYKTSWRLWKDAKRLI